MIDRCPHCDAYNEHRGRFCNKCGFDMDAAVPAEGDLLKKLMIVIALFCAVVIVIDVFCLIINAYDVFEFLNTKSYNVSIFIPMPIKIFTLSGNALGVYWILMVITIICCVGYGLYKFLISFSKGNTSTPENTGFFWGVNTSALMLFLTMAMVMVIMIAGIEEIENPLPSDPLNLMFSTANAAVWEELTDRVLFIGLPMTLVSLAMCKGTSALKCLLGGFGMSKFSLALIVISAVLFGASHFDLWDQYWKVLQTGIMGLLMGYVFVKFGLYATVIMHFFTNFMSSFDWMGMGGLGITVTFIIILAGFIVFIYLLTKMENPIKKFRALPNMPDLTNGDSKK